MLKSNKGACYEYRFTTTFEETNVVGNIYFANYALWQGKCREMFIYENCPDVINEINAGLALITLDLSVQFLSQLYAFDKVVMRMWLEAQSESRILMSFEYFCEKGGQLTLVAKGHQATAAMQNQNGRMVAVHYPASMLEVLEQYA